MEFTFDFDWRDYISKETFRTDEAAVAKATTRLCFSGVISSVENPTPKELHLDMQKAERDDYGEIRFMEDSNGRLRGRAVVTTIGVYPYLKEDGSVEWELRHPDDVYSDASLITLEMLPLTNNHPEEKVDQNNVQKLKVGHLGENVWVDTVHGYVTNAIVVDEAVAIQDAKNGKRGISCGYSCDIIDESGVWNGVPYTKRQKNIRYNHVSMVTRGRAGDAAIMKFDSYEGIQTRVTSTAQDNPVKSTVVNTDEEVTMGDEVLKTIKLDGVEYKAEAAVLTALHTATEKLDGFSTLQKDHDTLKHTLATVEGERDALKKDVGDLKVKLDGSIQADQLEALFQKRQKLDEAISLAKIEGSDKMDATGRMEAVIIAVDPTAKEVLESRKDSEGYQFYLEARFDSAISKLKTDESVLIQNLSSGAGNPVVVQGSTVKTDNDIWADLVDACSKSKKKGA